MEDGAHVVETGLEHVAAVDELRVCGPERIQHGLGARRGQRCQRHSFLHAEDARLGRAVAAAGVDEGPGLGHRHVGTAALVAQHFHEFDGAASAPRVQYDDLPILQVRGAALRHIAVRGGWRHDHDDLGISQCCGVVGGDASQRAEPTGEAVVAFQVDAPAQPDRGHALRRTVEERRMEAH